MSPQMPRRPTRSRRRTSLATAASVLVASTGLALLTAPPAEAGIDKTETTIIGDRVYQVDTSARSEEWSYSTGDGFGYSRANDLVWTSAADLDGWGALVAYDPNNLDVVREVRPRSFSAAYRTKAPDGLAIDDERGLVWASAGRDNAVLAIEQTTGIPVAKLGGVGLDTRTARSIAIDPVLDRIYLASYDHETGTGQITVIDATIRAVVARWDADDLGLERLAVGGLQVSTHDGNSRVYATDQDGRLLEVTDSATGEPQARIITDQPDLDAAHFAVSRAMGRAYLTHAGATSGGSDGGIVTVDLASGEVLNRVQVMDGQFSPTPIVLPHGYAVVDEERGEVYVGGQLSTTYSRNLTVIDAETGALVGATKVPDGVVVSGLMTLAGADLFVTRGSLVQRVRLTEEEPPPTGEPDKAVMEVVGTPRLGCPLLLRGTNWLVQNATAGSTIAIKLDDGAVRTPGGSDVWDLAYGTMPMGDVEKVITLPDGTTGPKGSNPAISAGPHWIRLLTGSTDGDLRRNPTLDIEVQPAGKCDPLPGDPTDPVETTITADPVSQVYGKTADLDITVSPEATGTVSIEAGPKTVTGTLSDGTATVTIPEKTVEPGTRAIAISYAGVEGEFAPSTGTAEVTVTKAKPRISVKTAKKVKRGKTAKVTVKVMAAGVKPTGKVTVKIAGARAKTTRLTKNGSALVKVKLPKGIPTGTRTVTATYRGDKHVAKKKTATTIAITR